MTEVLAVLPFVPAKDLPTSIAFYEAIGFHSTHTHSTIAILEQDSFRFGVKTPIAPTLQHWGLKAGFIFDPSGVLWHVAEPPS